MLLFEDLVFVAALNSPFSVFTSDLLTRIRLLSKSISFHVSASNYPRLIPV